jgi:hypothetical protein
MERPVAEDHKSQHREKRDDIDESLALEIARLRLCSRVQAIELEFLRSILRQLLGPVVGNGAALSYGSLTSASVSFLANFLFKRISATGVFAA